MDATRRTGVDRLYGRAADLAFASLWSGARWLGTAPSELDERAGRLPAAAAPLLWFHGASAGEMGAAAALSRLLRAAGFAFTAGYTASNRAGLDFAAAHAETGAVCALAPWDRPTWVARAFDRWQPRALFLLETELWPALVCEAAQRGVPVFGASARVFPRDVARYRAIRRWFAPTLARLAAVLAQSESERERLLRIGVAPERCIVAGNLKHAVPLVSQDRAWRARVAAPGEVLVVVGSVHADEIELAVDAITPVAARAARVVLAPRHLDSVDRLARAVRRRGLACARAAQSGAPSDARVILLDTIGELPRAYAGADVAIVGGGFARHGGHNLWEAVRGGGAVLFGRHFDDCEDDAARLARATPEARIESAPALAAAVQRLVADPVARVDLSARQRAALPDATAIAAAYVAALSPYLRPLLRDSPTGAFRTASAARGAVSTQFQAPHPEVPA